VADYAARLGVLQGERGRFVEALALLEEGERAAQAAQLPDSIARAGQLRVLARAHLRQRHAAQALPGLDRALAIVRQLPHPGIERVLRADRAYAAAVAAADPVPSSKAVKDIPAAAPAAEGPAPTAAAASSPRPAAGADESPIGPRAAAEAVVAAAMDELARVAAEQADGDARQRGHLPLHYLGQLQRLVGRPAEAVATLQLAEGLARASPRRVELAELLVDLALAHLDAGDSAAAGPVLDEADALLAAARAEPLPASADLAMARARIAHAEGRRADAAAFARAADAHWRRAATASGRSAGVAAYWRARTLADDGQPAASLWREAARGLSMSAFAADEALRQHALQMLARGGAPAPGPGSRPGRRRPSPATSHRAAAPVGRSLRPARGRPAARRAGRPRASWAVQPRRRRRARRLPKPG
jgi:tetratricopeptide (TPR) repeat protein